MSEERRKIPAKIEDWDKLSSISEMLWDSIESDLIQTVEDAKFWKIGSIEKHSWPRRLHISIDFTLWKKISLSDSQAHRDFLEDINLDFNTIYPDQLDFQLILSNMGSVTLRPLDSKKAPIFYMSLGKFSDDSFQWENEDSERLDPNLWKQYFGNAIDKYLHFLNE